MPRSERASFGPSGKGYKRADRVGKQVWQVIAEHLERTTDDSLALMTITGVSASPDLRNATIFYTVYGDEKAAKKVAAALVLRARELRSTIAHSVRLKFTPALTFEVDTTIEQRTRIEQLLADIRNSQRDGDDA